MKNEERLKAMEMKEKFKIAMNTIIDEEFDLLLKQVETGHYKLTDRDINEIIAGFLSASHSNEWKHVNSLILIDK